MNDADGAPILDPWRDILGIDVPVRRLQELTVAYADILAAIRTLRELDLGDVHPAVIFHPVSGGTERA